MPSIQSPFSPLCAYPLSCNSFAIIPGAWIIAVKGKFAGFADVLYEVRDGYGSKWVYVWKDGFGAGLEAGSLLRIGEE